MQQELIKQLNLDIHTTAFCPFCFLFACVA